MGGSQAKSINRRNNLRGGRTGAREQGGEDIRGQPPSHPVSHRVRRKERCTEIEKDKSPEEKGSWDNVQ